ncbi:Type 1 glutamine amidotransferase-like domain-containing protein [Candidatus Dojkabacteria bacterium]|nr:Type 1 glutamine amidotransferase-like domain-containing protein [Candidatus Dojkabacteria bacterium]
MKLFLASEAKNPASIRKLKKFVNKDFSKLSIAYIPTAANGEYYGSWKGGDSIQVATKLGAKVKVVELEDSTYKNVLDEIKGADILWIAGGMSGYLLYWIRRVKLDKAIPKILKSGTIYVGSSAGSMICAKTQYSAEWFFGEEEPGCSLIPGLGLIDFEIYPHYEDVLFDRIKRKWKKGKLCLLKNDEAVTVVNDKIKVLGKERFIEK